jgi:hypothetical protein
MRDIPRLHNCTLYPATNNVLIAHHISRLDIRDGRPEFLAPVLVASRRVDEGNDACTHYVEVWVEDCWGVKIWARFGTLVWFSRV